jgi:hypothetical protein
MQSGVKKIEMVQRAAALRHLREQRLSISAPDGAVERTLQWAKVRLDGALSEPLDLHAAADAAPIVWTALARLAVGDFDAAAAQLRVLAVRQEGGAHPAEASLYLLLAARYHAWTAHLPFLLEEWPRLRVAAELCRDASSTLVLEAIRAAALRELAITAESIGEAVDAVALATAAKHARHALDRLRGVAPAPEHPLPVLLGVAEDSGSSLGPAGCSWAAWAEFACGQTENGYRRWRFCFSAQDAEPGELHSVGLLDRRANAGAADPAWPAALAAATLVHGLLGVEPDAARHRLTLRPQIPAAWHHMEVRQLAMGDALFSLDYRRTGPRHEFVVEQTAGAVPVNLVFEPAIAMRALGAVTVDGEAAQLDAKPFGERMLAPVQLVLDHTRTLVVESKPL